MSNSWDKNDAFRTQALSNGLDLGYDHDKFKKYWVLNLNQGTIWTAREYIEELYELACDVFGARNSGEHIAIRQLVCKRNDLNKDKVYWERPYYTNVSVEPELWISIGEFLGL